MLREDETRRSHLLTVYAVNLVMNFFWSIIFFNMRAFLFAFIWLVILEGVIFIMIREFAKVKKWLGYLQIPYFLWVLFAGVLNFRVYILN